MKKKLMTTGDAINRTKQFLAHEARQSAGDNGRPDLNELTKTVGTSAVYAIAGTFPQYDDTRITVGIRKKIRRDPQIRLALSVIKAPILGLPLQVTSKDKDIAGFIQEALSPIWRSVLRSSLTAVDFGHAPHEKLFEVKDITVTNEDGKEKTHRNAIVYHKLKDLDPEHITAYLFDENGGFAGFDWYNDVRVPAEKSFVMVNEKEFGNPYGRSRLDCIYDPWYWCNVIFLFANRYYERKADPTTKARSPAIPKQGGGMEVDSNFVTAVGNMKNSSTLVMSSQTTDGKYNYDVEYLLDDKRGEMFKEYIDMLQALKLRGMLVPERVLTQDTRVGSLAMVETMTDTFLKMEQQLIAELFEHINKFIINPLVEFNFGKEAPKAYAIPGSITEQNTDLLKEIIFKVIDAEMDIGSGKPYETASIINTAKMLENLNVPIEIPEKKKKEASIQLSSHILDAPVSVADIDRFADKAMKEFNTMLEAERFRLEEPIKKHNKNVIKTILKNLKNAKFVDNRLSKHGNEGLKRNIIKDVDTLHSKFLNSLAIEEKKIVNNYLSMAQKLANKHYDELIRETMQLARRETTGVRLPRRGVGEGLAGAKQILRDNEFGIQQNIQNIAIREDRRLEELIVNAIGNERIMLEIDFVNLLNAPSVIISKIDDALKEIDNTEFAIKKDSGLIAELKNYRFNAGYTDATVTAHFRAVYRRTIIENAKDDGINIFKAYHSKDSEDTGACATYDGRIGTLDWWDIQAERLGAGGGIRQFGLHFGCKTMFYPIPVELLAKETIKVETLQDT